MSLAVPPISAPFRTIGTELASGAPVTGVVWVGDVAAYALGDGSVHFLGTHVEERGWVQAHKGTILCAAAAPDKSGVITGGDDGRLVRASIDGSREQIAGGGSRWIEHLAIAQWGGIAWSQGRGVEVRMPTKGSGASYELPSSCGGLAFGPKGQRLAAAHYGGATLYWPGIAGSQPDLLEWKGSHIAVTWSPDARFLITAMQESAIHGWRLGDKENLQMSGFPAKPRSLSWSPKGDWLVCSGATSVVMWPFKGKNGPMGKGATERAVRERLATVVAFHPRRDLVAVAFADGEITFARLEDDLERTGRPADGGSVTALAWSSDGAWLAYGTAGGSMGMIDATRLIQG